MSVDLNSSTATSDALKDVAGISDFDDITTEDENAIIVKNGAEENVPSDEVLDAEETPTEEKSVHDSGSEECMPPVDAEKSVNADTQAENDEENMLEDSTEENPSAGNLDESITAEISEENAADNIAEEDLVDADDECGEETAKENGDEEVNEDLLLADENEEEKGEEAQHDEEIDEEAILQEETMEEEEEEEDFLNEESMFELDVADPTLEAEFLGEEGREVDDDADEEEEEAEQDAKEEEPQKVDENGEEEKGEVGEEKSEERKEEEEEEKEEEDDHAPDETTDALDAAQEESEEEDDDEDGNSRDRFKSERGSSIISLSGSSSIKKAAIPDKLEISKEDEEQINRSMANNRRGFRGNMRQQRGSHQRFPRGGGMQQRMNFLGQRPGMFPNQGPSLMQGTALMMNFPRPPMQPFSLGGVGPQIAWEHQHRLEQEQFFRQQQQHGVQMHNLIRPMQQNFNPHQQQQQHRPMMQQQGPPMRHHQPQQQQQRTPPRHSVPNSSQGQPIAVVSSQVNNSPRPPAPVTPKSLGNQILSDRAKRFSSMEANRKRASSTEGATGNGPPEKAMKVNDVDEDYKQKLAEQQAVRKQLLEAKEMRRKQGAEPKRKELEKKIEQKVPQSIPIRQPPPSTQRLPVAPQTQAPRPRFQQQQTQRFQQQPHPFRQQHQRQQFPSQQQRFQSQPQQQQRYNQQQREPKTRHLQTLTPTHGNPHSYPHQQQHQQQQQYQQQGNQQQQFYNNDNPSYANNNQQYNQQNNQQRMGRGGYQNQRVIKQINMLPEDAMPQQSYQQPPQRTIIPPRQRPNNNRTVVMLNEGGGGDNQSTCLVSNLSMSTNLGRVNNMASSCGRVLRVNQQPGPNGQRNIKVMFEDPRGAREFVSRFNRQMVDMSIVNVSHCHS